MGCGSSGKHATESTVQAGRSTPAAKPIPVSELKTLIRPRLWAFGDFEASATVGVGTYSRVCVVKIKDNSDRSPMALKIMKKSELIRLKQVVHVKEEKNVLNMVEHPFIVNLLTSFQDERHLYMLMEYVNGGELWSHLQKQKQKRLPSDHARFYAGEIILAVMYLHSLNIIYRDLKPENLLIDCEGHLKITDFGYAKAVDELTYTACGTPEYTAPEIIENKGHGKEVDWWSLGIVIFQMLTGEPPFTDDDPAKIYEKILAGKLSFPKYFDGDVKDLVTGLLKSDKAQRQGGEQLKQHQWYGDMNWEQLLKREVTPPFFPNVEAADDTSMFDKFPDKIEEDTTPALGRRSQELFVDFSAQLDEG